MQSIVCHSIPIKEVLRDLAHELDVSVHQNCDEYVINIPARYGTGSIKGIDFKDGLAMLLYDCTFIKNTEIRFIVDHVHPLKFLFCETGNLTHAFENETLIHHLDFLENIIVASCDRNGHILRFSAGVKTVVNSIEINRAKFVLTKECTLKTLNKILKSLFLDINASQMFYHHGPYCVNMADLFKEISQFKEENFLRHIFLEGSAYRVLTLQIIQYKDDIAPAERQSVLRKIEIQRIRDASAIIEGEILDYKSVQHLSEQVGINSNKLQNGFRELYDLTVNEYVFKRRLDVANGLLKNSDHSISEIVFLIGLSSKSYFSKIFKEKYGRSPSEIRKSRNQRLN